MSGVLQRQPLVVCIAPSAGQFPPHVRSWLEQATCEIAWSPDVYDSLASLACGLRPAAFLVSIDMIDWNELGFFQHAAKLNRSTRLFVAGSDQHAAKLQAACKSGAALFDAETIDADLRLLDAGLDDSRSKTLLAGEVDPVMRAGTGTDTRPAARFTGMPSKPVSPSKPTFRLVEHEPDEAEPAKSDDLEEDVPVAVPWKPSNRRPQRTPPSSETHDEASTSEESPSAQQEDSAEAYHPSRIELSPEELAALLGQPGGEDHDARGQEQSS